MAGNYEENRRFADSWSQALSKIITDNIGVIASVKPAGNAADRSTCTDFIVSTSSGNTVAARIRRSDVKFRDFTLRAKNGAARTELEKIRDGYGDWFLYAWTAGSGSVADWILVDLNRLRMSGLLDAPRDVTDNGDGTGFVAYTRRELTAADCLAKEMHELRIPQVCGYGKHRWRDLKEGGRKAARCEVCGKLYGYYASPDSPSVLSRMSAQ